MKPRIRMALETAVEAGVNAGVRAAWKHTDDPWPNLEQQDTIVEAVLQSMQEWFYVDDEARNHE